MSSYARIGDYELIEIVGRGGCATVWKARHTKLNRLSAVKVFDGPLEQSATLSRFLREAQIAAFLRHPNIVSILDISSSDDSAPETTPYIAYEFIEGVTLSEWIRFAKMSFRETATIAAKLAAALHFSHQQGIVHRDLKPDNILVELSGEPKITDFGLARQIDDRMTEPHVTLGTVAYLSPEQARGDSGGADARADVYALGVILFEMLTGQLPFRGKSIPSYLAQVAGSEPDSPRSINSKIPKDLETICLKCLSQTPESRYTTAEAAEEDLKRFAEGRPILARPVRAPERLRRWCARNPLAATFIAVLLGLAVMGPLVAWRQFALRTSLDRRGNRLAAANYRLDLSSAYRAWNEGYLRQARKALDRAAVQTNGQDLRGFAWRFLDQRLRESYRVVAESETPIFDAVLTSSGEHLLAVGSTNAVLVWSVADPKLVRKIPLPAEQYFAIALFPDDNTVVVGDEVAGKTQLRCYDWRSGELQRTIDLAATNTIESIQVSVDGEFVSIGTRYDRIELYDQAWNQVMAFEADSRHETVAFSPDGRYLAYKHNNDVQVRDLNSKEIVGSITLPRSDCSGILWRPDGGFLAAYGEAIRVGLVKFPEMEQVHRFRASQQEKTRLVFYPDGRSAAGGCIDGMLFVEHAALADEVRNDGVNYYPHDAKIRSLLYLPGGNLLSCSDDGTAAITRPGAVALAGAHFFMKLGEHAVMAYSKRLDRLLVGDRSGRLWRGDGSLVAELDGGIDSLNFLADGRSIACGRAGGRISILSAEDYSVLNTLDRPATRGEVSASVHTPSSDGRTCDFAASADGSWGVSTSSDNFVRFWSLRDRKSVREIRLSGPRNPILLHDEQGLVYVADGEERILAFDLNRERDRFSLHAGVVNDLAYHAPRSLLISAHANGGIRAWDLESRQVKANLRGHKSEVLCLALCHDQKTLASGGKDGAVRLWDLSSFTEIGVAFQANTGWQVTDIAFLKDETSLAALLTKLGTGSKLVKIGSTAPKFQGYTVPPTGLDYKRGTVRSRLVEDPDMTRMFARVDPGYGAAVGVWLDERCQGYEVRAHFKVDIRGGKATAQIEHVDAKVMLDEAGRPTSMLGQSREYFAEHDLILSTDWVRITHGTWDSFHEEQANPYAATLWFDGVKDGGVYIHWVKIETREYRD